MNRCSQCAVEATPRPAPNGSKTVDIPLGWSSLTLTGQPELHRLLCARCASAVRHFLVLTGSAVQS